MKNAWLSFAVFLFSAGCVQAGDAFEPFVFKAADGTTLPYRLLKPKNYDPQQKYPLIFFMHGAGERGTDNVNQTKHGGKLFSDDANRTKFPSFVVAPQVPNGKLWVNVPWGDDSHVQPETPSDVLRVSLELIASLQKEFSIDPKRLYAMGISMGGFGVWDVVTRHPDMFAAAAPICGGADENNASLIAKLPVWTFHGDKDGVVKTKRSRNMIEALKKVGSNAKYSEYPGVGHDSWNKAFAEPELLTWLFAQKKN